MNENEQVVTEVMENGVEVTTLLPAEKKSRSGLWIGISFLVGLGTGVGGWAVTKLVKKGLKKRLLKKNTEKVEDDDDIDDDDDFFEEDDDDKK